MSKHSYQASKPLFWVGSSKRDYGEFPAEIQNQFGFELFLVQTGQYPPSAKPLKGFGSGVLELAEQHSGGAYRAVYSVHFRDAVYVLHAFQKKSRQGISTAKRDIDLVRRRLKDADEHHAASAKEQHLWSKKQKS